MMVNVEARNENMYNSDMKSEYIAEMINDGHISEETAKSYLRIFVVTADREEELKKDLCYFTFAEIEEILYEFKSNNRNTIESYARIISAYLRWAEKKGYTKESVMSDMKPDDFIKYLTNNEVYFSDLQLMRYEDNCENYQDAVILRLLFEGVGGRQFSEIRNLKKEDIDFESGRIRLVSTLKEGDKGIPLKYTERYLQVSERTLKLIRGAIDQKLYVKKNGELNQTASNNIRPYTDLVDNGYVVRPSITKTENWFHPVDKYVIYRRIASISESLGIEELTAKFIQRSGMIYQANLLMQDDNISLEDLKIIADRFNIKSYHNLKGFITINNILATYPKE